MTHETLAFYTDPDGVLWEVARLDSQAEPFVLRTAPDEADNSPKHYTMDAFVSGQRNTPHFNELERLLQARKVDGNA